MAAASSRWQRMAAACFVLAALAMWAAPAACGARAVPRGGGRGGGAAGERVVVVVGGGGRVPGAAQPGAGGGRGGAAAVERRPGGGGGEDDVAAAGRAGAAVRVRGHEREPYGANQGGRATRRARGGGGVVGGAGRYYAHANNSCAPGQQCGTYTQVGAPHGGGRLRPGHLHHRRHAHHLPLQPARQRAGPEPLLTGLFAAAVAVAVDVAGALLSVCFCAY